MKTEQTIKDLAEKYGCKLGELKQAIENIENGHVILYAMSGKMGAGKDTIGDIVKENLEQEGKFVKQFSYSSPMKEEMQLIIDLTNKGLLPHELEEEIQATQEEITKFLEILGNNSVYERSDASRLAIQYWGTNVRRKQNANYWINKLVQLIIQEVNKGNSVFVSDVRFENEANSILDLKGKVVRLEADEAIRIDRILKRDNLRPTKEHLNHLSEIALDNYVFDKVFDNSGDLKNATEKVTQYIKEVK